MMNEELDIQRSERIHAYVLGSVSTAERSAFEQELATDPTLRDEVAAERTLMEAIHQEPELRFRQLVQRVSQTQEQVGEIVPEETPVIPIGRRFDMRWMAAAAGVLVLLGVSLWFLSGQDADYRSLALAELQQPPSATRSAGEGTTVIDSLQQVASKRLQSGQWQELLSFTEMLLEREEFTDRYGDRTRLDRAWALMKLDRPNEARDELGQVNAADAAIQAERAYYLALAYLLEADAESAREALRDVQAPFPWDERIARLQEAME